MTTYAKEFWKLITGILLTAEFLLWEHWMRSPKIYDSNQQEYVYRLDIGFHWSILLGMAGVLLVVVSLQKLLQIRMRFHWMMALTAFLVNTFSWKFFLESGETYYQLEGAAGGTFQLQYGILYHLSLVFLVILGISLLIWSEQEKAEVWCEILSLLVLLTALGALVLKTPCNRWYLWCALGTVAVAGLWKWGTEVWAEAKQMNEEIWNDEE